MFIKILNKRWEIKLVNSKCLPKKYGDCDSPDKKGKQIRVWNKLSGEKKLRILIHEMLHAADWYKDEEWIENVSDDLARTLTRLGYENKHEKD